MLGWLRKRRRTRLRSQPFPEESLAHLVRHVPYYDVLSPEAREELIGHVQVLLHEKHFEGCRHFEITDEVRVAIAGHAGCLLLGRETGYFPRLKSILVYPSLFIVDEDEPEADGTVSRAADPHAGQSWDLGVVVLAWDEVLKSSRHLADGYNVVLHEFAHQLDFEDNVADGTPGLHDPALYKRWIDVLGTDYDQLVKDVRRGRRTVLDAYGATDEAEFFAVATETFFEAPARLLNRHPDLYDVLRAYYKQDPEALLQVES